MSSNSTTRGNKSPPDPINFHIPKYSWETETQCDEFTQEIPKYSWESDSCSSENISSPRCDVHIGSIEEEFAQKPDSPDPNLNVDEIQERLCKEEEPASYKGNLDNYKASSSHYSDMDDAQRPESPNLNLDLEAIQRELCEDLPDSPLVKRKRKKGIWSKRTW